MAFLRFSGAVLGHEHETEKSVPTEKVSDLANSEHTARVNKGN
jgi:hypothetical protein